MRVKIPLAKPYIDSEDIEGVVKVLKSNVLSNGSHVNSFEKSFAQYLGVKYACAVSSGTAGLHIAVKSLDLKRVDELITTPFSFIASSNVLLYEGVRPVFVDVEEQTFNIDPDKIENSITEKTKAILVVHVFDQAANMDKVLSISRKYNLKIIEDSCESLGAKYKSKKVGTLGDVSIFAFYPNKQITTGEGGMLVTNNKDIHELALSLRNQGRNLNNDWLVHERLGYNYRMDELSAALGITQLAKIKWILKKRQEIANLYNKYLLPLKEIKLPNVAHYNTPSWFVYVIRVPSKKRDAIMNYLIEKGIQVKNYFPVIHLQPFMRKLFNFKIGDFPVSERVASETLALPFFIGLKEEEIVYISDSLRRALQYAK